MCRRYSVLSRRQAITGWLRGAACEATHEYRSGLLRKQQLDSRCSKAALLLSNLILQQPATLPAVVSAAKPWAGLAGLGRQ